MSSSSTAEFWLFELKHHKLFSRSDVDLENPHGKAMCIFQDFTITIIDGLERNAPATVNLARDGSLATIYDDLPVFEISSFKLWVKDATLKHPHRRTAAQHKWLHIVQLQGDVKSATDIVISAIAEVEEWKERVYAPENLHKDPEATYFFRNKNGISSNISAKDKGKESEKECLICTNAFTTTHQLHVRQQAPCGHIICRACFQKWLRESKGTYTCPLCRACVICGANNCEDHNIKRDLAPPVALPLFLNDTLPDKVDDALHGLAPDYYWELREATRKDRSIMAYIDYVLRIEQTEAVRVVLSRDAEEAVAWITKEITKAVVKTQARKAE
jgi:hypothetical protein